MHRKLHILAFLIVLLAGGGSLWPMGQKMDIFVPVDALIADKRYPEAIDMLRGMLVSIPSRSSAIKDRIASTEILEADFDIDSKLYNDALSALSLFWAQNPDRADEAQTRIKKINKVREQYNKLAKELLAFMSEATNRSDINYNREVTRRIAELEDLDPNNADAKKTILSLKETSLALVNQDSMRTYMSSGRALIDSREYARAAREYARGFSLFQYEFEHSSYDELTIQAIRNEAQKAEALPAAYDAVQAGLQRSLADLSAAFDSGQSDRVGQAMPAAGKALDDLRTVRESAFAVGGGMARSFASIPKEGKSPVEYQYLAYLDIFLRGRPDSFGTDKKPANERGKAEGIGGAMLSQTEALLDQLGASALAAVDSSYQAAEKLYDSGSYLEAAAAFSSASALISPARKIISGWSLIDPKDFVPDLAALRVKIAKAAGDEARLGQLLSLAGAGARLADLAAASQSLSAESSAYVSGLGAGIPLGEARAAQDAFRKRMRDIETSLAVEQTGREALARESAAAAELLGDDRPTVALASYSARLDKAVEAARSGEDAAVTARARLEGDYIEKELALRSASVASGESQIEGAPSLLPERARAGYKDPSPSKAILALEAERPRVEALLGWIGEDLAALAKEGSSLAAQAPFAEARSRIEALQAKARALQAQRADAAALAAQRKKAAEAALAEGRQNMEGARAKLAETKALIAQNKGKGAKAEQIKRGLSDSRSSLDSGLTSVVASSNLDFVPAAWDDAQALYSRLNADIAQTKKDYVIAGTFTLLGEGQTYYYQALFDLAAESLNGAQDLWHEDNDADQELVKYWQNLVRQASDSNNKREVKQSDALYYEISSYLSEARKYYLKGVELIKAGRQTDAASALDAAKRNLSFVTGAFPLNAEAGLLTLQILKSTDAEAYKKSLPRRVNEAVALLDTDASAGYSRIADLYKMEPGYPGLKALLDKAEIKVGRKKAPPTKQELARAAALVAEAQSLLNTGRKDDQARALSDANQAQILDPANKLAFAILRDITTLQGKSAGPILGLADKAILDQATSLFASSKYNQARDQLSLLYNDATKRTRDVLKLDNDLKTLGY